ncbi:MAG: hypothetical protein LBN95_00525 [Prevotellaceae bacterium]|jgi:hypothetical protein|nr:hypothetical protein [Prevotellaceae bacterium]
MKKILMIFSLIACFSVINAQTVVVYYPEEEQQEQQPEPQQPEYVLPLHDIQFSFGDGIVYSGMDIDDALGAYSISYYYNLKKWIALGGYVTYAPSRDYRYYEYYNPYGYGYYDYTSTKSIAHNVSFNFSVRFTYLNRPAAKLYSGAGLGLSHTFYSDDRKMEIKPSAQMTFFGFEFGKKFYIGGEIGIGYKGFFTTNLGYRF